jgi:hypothetical protein
LASLARKVADASRLQLLFLSVTWLAGIYVNGFVPILPATGAGAILLNPAVGSHVVLATLSAATSVFILALSWAEGSRRPTAFALLAVVAIVLAGDSGLAFVLGGGSDAAQSMIMGSSFVTALFLTFLSLESARTEGELPKRAAGRSGALLTCYSALLLFYLVFVSGIYLNLYVAGPVFSLPLGLEPAAFDAAKNSAAFVAHEALGAALLASLVLLAASLWSGGDRRGALASAVPAILVAYSAYVGSMNLTSPPSAALAASPFVPMLSSAGLAAATVVTMLLALRLRGVSAA